MTISTQTLAGIRQNFDENPARAHSLHKDCYIDASFLAIERREIFHRSWQFVCHEEKLPGPGCYMATEVQGQSIFVCRNAAGQLRGFYNVCRHRAHELLRGTGETNLIVCPYHAWAYTLDGRLAKVRGEEFIENFDKDEICLHAIRVEVFCHLIFVNLDLLADPLAQQSESLADEILSFAPDLGRLTFAHRLTYTVEANWKAVVDNFLECYHCPVAHKDFCTLVDMDTYKVTTHGIYSSHMARAGLTDNTAYSVDGASVTEHAVWFLWPNTTLMRYPGRGNFMVWRFYPVGPEQTHEVFDFFFEDATPNAAEMASIEFIDEVLQPEDIGLVESVQRGMRTPAFAQGRYMVDPAGSGMSEHAVHHFHSLLLAAYRRAVEEQV